MKDRITCKPEWKGFQFHLHTVFTTPRVNMHDVEDSFFQTNVDDAWMQYQCLIGMNADG